MNIYDAGADITITIPLNADGKDLVATSASYKVEDGSGVELTNDVIAVNGSEEELEITVLAIHNQIAVGATHEARMVSLQIVTPTGTNTIRETYLIESQAFLQIPSQSGVTLQNSFILALTVGQGVSDAWQYADDRDRKGALIEAWRRLSRMRFNPWRSWETPDETLSDEIICLDFRVNELASEDWNKLPQHFRDACQRAQFIEANVILDGDPTYDRRMDGLISKTVGESSEMFRSGKPMQTPMSPKAMAELTSYTRRQIKIARR